MAAMESNVPTKAMTAMDEVTKSGAFKRSAATFRNFITHEGPFQPEAGRYHLYISYACPWASRCLAVLQLKGLQDVVSFSTVYHIMRETRPDDRDDKHIGWIFAKPGTTTPGTSGHGEFVCDSEEDTINGAPSVRALYESTGTDPGKYTVPILWDKKTHTVVNNESSEIIVMFNSAFDSIAANPTLDLNPKALRARMAEVDHWIYHDINNGVYKCGFAKTQSAYESAFHRLFAALDRAEEILSTSRYLCGSQMTLSDIRLFVTLIRFDAVYVVHFKCNRKFVHQYPNLFNFTKELYQIPTVKSTVNWKHIKEHYHGSHETINPLHIVPVGPDLAMYEDQHDRDRL